MSKSYDPRKAIHRATRAMDEYVRKSGPSVGVTEPVYTTKSGIAPVCVLLKSITDRGPCPDDFQTLTSGEQIKRHVRSDGAVFVGAFELQGDRESVVLVYGDPAMKAEQAERLATMERPELIRRQQQHALGPFAAQPTLTLSP